MAELPKHGLVVVLALLSVVGIAMAQPAPTAMRSSGRSRSCAH